MAYNNPNILSGVSLNFKDRTLVFPSATIIVALVVLVATLLFALFVPRPSTQGVGKAANEVDDVKRQITTLKTQQAIAGQIVAERAWIGSQNGVSASVLASLTAQARNDGLLIGSFQPQRTTDLAGITELPYAVQVNGPYLGVRQMLRSLDTPASKVVLRSAQITAATNSTTDVSATLGLSAYLATDPIILAAATDAHQKKTPAKSGAKLKAAAGAGKSIDQPLAVTITSKPITRTGANTHGRSNAVPVTGKKNPPVSRPVIYAAVLACMVGTYLYLTSPNQSTTTAKRHKNTTVSTTTGADANGITAADYKAHFPRYPGTGRNPFVPSILTASQQNASASALLGGKSGALGSWSLTGVTVINGAASALIESSSGDSITLKKGDQWHGLRVASISSDAVSFTNDFGQSTQLSFNSGTAGSGANPNAPAVPSPEPIQPLPPLNVAAQANTGSAIITGLPPVAPIRSRNGRSESNGGSVAASSASQDSSATVTTVVTDRPS